MEFTGCCASQRVHRHTTTLWSWWSEWGSDGWVCDICGGNHSCWYSDIRQTCNCKNITLSSVPCLIWDDSGTVLNSIVVLMMKEWSKPSFVCLGTAYLQGYSRHGWAQFPTASIGPVSCPAEWAEGARIEGVVQNPVWGVVFFPLY